jgi:hypothetical protein
MRYALVLLMLSACTYNVTLLPRTGGQKAYGWFNDGSKNMEVVIGNDTYRGEYVKGGSTGIAFGPGGGIYPAFSATNQHSAVLVGSKGNVRCEWVLQSFSGNGACQDPTGTLYDLVVGRK